jgi:DNA-binding response OmpR family regulator
MPVLDGLEVLRRLRRDQRTASVPVIILTARKQDRQVLAALALGAHDYLVKPFIPDELIGRIAKLLARHGRSAA